MIPTEALEAIIAGTEGCTPGPWTLDDFPDYVDGTTMEVLDKQGFPVADILSSPIINRYPERYPEMNHWAEGADDGRTQIHRDQAELAANAAHIARLSPEVVRAMATMAKEAARLRLALAWLDHYDPEMVAAAEDKFGFKLTKDDAVKALTEGATHGR